MEQKPQNQQSAEQQLQEQLLAGVQGKTKQTGKIRDQLRDLFEPNDFVTVRNPFDHITGWAFVNPAKELSIRPDKITKRTTFGAPETRILKPGESVVIHGWEAYIAIGRMFKEYAQEQGANMIIVLSSQEEIDKFISKTFGGVFDPNAQMNAINVQAVGATTTSSDDPLGFNAPATETRDGVDESELIERGVPSEELDKLIEEEGTAKPRTRKKAN